MKSFCAKLSISMHFSSVRSALSCTSRHLKSLLKAIVNSCKNPFDTSLSRIMDYEMLFLCFSFTMPSALKSPLLDDIVRDWENIQVPLVWDVGWTYSLKRYPHKCKKQFLGSNKKSILSIAPLELFRVTQIALLCPCHESSCLIFH